MIFVYYFIISFGMVCLVVMLFVCEVEFVIDLGKVVIIFRLVEIIVDSSNFVFCFNIVIQVLEGEVI